MRAPFAAILGGDYGAYVRLIRAVFLPVWATIFVTRGFFRAWRAARREGVDMSVALDQWQTMLQAEADQEAEREARMQEVREAMRGMPPPP